MGIAYDYVGRPVEAQASYDRALAQSPQNPAVLNNVALSRALAGDLEGGIAILEQQTKRPTAQAQVRQNLALLYALKGDLSKVERLASQDLPERIVKNNLAYFRDLDPNKIELTAATTRIPLPTQLGSSAVRESIPTALEDAPAAVPAETSVKGGASPVEVPSKEDTAVDQGTDDISIADVAPDRGMSGIPGSATEQTTDPVNTTSTNNKETVSAHQEPAIGEAKHGTGRAEPIEAITYAAQVGAFRDPDGARRYWNTLSESHPDLLSDVGVDFKEQSRGADRGSLYLVWVGNFPTVTSAKGLCTSLRQRQVDCAIAKMDK